jgi:hypothetical protein
MKAVIITIGLVLALTSIAMARPPVRQGPPGPIGPQGVQGEQGIQGLQGDAGRNGEGVNRQTPVGVGLDAVLWQSPKEVFGVETQYRFDERNNEHSVFAVGKVNIWKLFHK